MFQNSNAQTHTQGASAREQANQQYIMYIFIRARTPRTYSQSCHRALSSPFNAKPTQSMFCLLSIKIKTPKSHSVASSTSPRSGQIEFPKKFAFFFFSPALRSSFHFALLWQNFAISSTAAEKNSKNFIHTGLAKHIQCVSSS